MIMDINKLSSKIIGAAIEVHKALGPGDSTAFKPARTAGQFVGYSSHRLPTGLRVAA